MQNVVTAVLGGGQGTRLWPLTRDRAKPAVPVAGKFRLIDIPISNSLHAGIERIFVLTQFNTASLHRHITQTYRFDAFRRGFVNILAAEQSLENRDWYQGTADAVRQNLRRLLYLEPAEILILSGDQLYVMDLHDFVLRHREKKADLTVAVSAVSKAEASSFGLMKVDAEGRIVEFVEKPQDEAIIDSLVVPEQTLQRLGFEPRPDLCLASMGIYVFRRGILADLLLGTGTTDFGKQVIPEAIQQFRVFAYGYPGYWRDIGTIPAFHEASLELTLPNPPLDLYSPTAPIYTHPRFLPGTRIDDCSVRRSLVCEGGILSGAEICDSVIGIRARIRRGSIIERSVVMGEGRFAEEGTLEELPLGIGCDCKIRNAIIDFGVRIGDGSQLLNVKGVEEEDQEDYAIRGGIIVVPRGATIPPGTVI